MKLPKNLMPALVGAVMAMSLLAATGCGDDEDTSASTSGDTAAATADDAMTSDDAMAKEDGVMVGGAAMVPSKDIVENASAADNVTTLVDLVKKADLVETLQGEGPFTVFGPTNDAFGKLDPATVKSLQEPANKDQLAAILTYHVIPGKYAAADLTKLAEDGETLKTVQGEKLTPKLKDGDLVIEDAQGNEVGVETADAMSSNGVTHIVDSVLMPKG